MLEAIRRIERLYPPLYEVEDDLKGVVGMTPETGIRIGAIVIAVTLLSLFENVRGLLITVALFIFFLWASVLFLMCLINPEVIVQEIKDKGWLDRWIQ